MITKEKAYSKMAALMKAEMDLWEKTFKKSYGDPFSSDDVKQLSEEQSKLFDEKQKDLQREINNFATILYSHPAFMEIMIPWMVDIEGEDLPCDFVEKVIKSGKLNITDQLSETHKPIAIIRKAIESWGLIITDSGGGCGGWHLGVPCNDNQSKTLCNSMYAAFGYWIEEEVITVKRKWWKPRLPGLYNWHDVRKYYQRETI